MKQSQVQIFLRFLKFGLLAWGGPVAQIAMIKKELVEEEQWISKEEFNRALAVYQALPGPEAHELCVYFGVKAGGKTGGLLAGLGFMLPGFMLMLLFTWLYVRFGIASSTTQHVFAGIQTAVIALIVFAVYRIGKHSVVNIRLLIIALVAGLAFFLGVNFMLVLAIAGFSYSFLQKGHIALVVLFAALILGLTLWTMADRDFKLLPPSNEHVIQARTTDKSESKVLVSGLKAGLLTFGGAYTAIPFVRQDALVNGWMTEKQFLDGVAISGILPAPLIIFSTFVGYFGAGWTGALLITIAVFLPAFAFTLIGYNGLEKLMRNKTLHHFLDGVTAAVVGLIAVTACQLFYSTITKPLAFLIFILALLTLIKFRSKYIVPVIIIGAGLIGLIWG
jgi:chromate transporter